MNDQHKILARVRSILWWCGACYNDKEEEWLRGDQSSTRARGTNVHLLLQ